MKNIPEKIYLQLGGAKEDPYEDFNSLVGVTWHKENVYFDDIEYVLATSPEGKEVDIEKLREEYNKEFKVGREGYFLGDSKASEIFDFFKPHLTNGKEKNNSGDLIKFINDNLEKSKAEVLKEYEADKIQFLQGWIAALMHVKVNYLELSPSLVQGGEKEEPDFDWMDFIKWYSGVTEDKILNAIDRFRREI